MIRSTITRLLKLKDVDPTGLADGDTMVWDATAGKFEPGASSGGGSSVAAAKLKFPSAFPASEAPADFLPDTDFVFITDEAAYSIGDAGLVVEAAGLYQIVYCVKFEGVGGFPGRKGSALLKNGNNPDATPSDGSTNCVSNYAGAATHVVTVVMELDAGDELSVTATEATGGGSSDGIRAQITALKLG
jgi:hypothetical protein